MAINIKNLEARIQKKAASVTSNTPTAELGDIIEAANLATGGLAQYDSAGLLPTASSTQNIKMAYLKKDNSIRFNSGSAWNKMTPGAAVGGAVSTAPTVPVYAGTEYGYAFNSNPAPNTSVFDRYSFTSDANSTDLGTDVGSPTLGRVQMQGGGGETKGFHSGGFNPASPTGPGQQATYIASFPYASGTPLADTTYQLFAQRRYGNREMIGDRTNIYYAGGSPYAGGATNVIDKHPETVSANATDVGDLIEAQIYTRGTSSPTHGYILGGYTPTTPVVTDRIQKFSFASDANAVDVSNLVAGVAYNAGAASSTHGYSMGGGYPTATDLIQSFPFAAETDATDTTANLTSTRSQGAGTTSSTHGYINAGANPGDNNIIEKFPFANSTADATDVGDLQKARVGAGTSQN